MDLIRIALVDDHTLFRQCLTSLINSVPEFTMALESGDGEEFLEKLAGKSDAPPQIVLLDMEMPGMDGILLQEQLQKRYPEMKVIILSIHDKQRLIAQMIRSGACGYLIKNCDKEELLTAIRSVYENGFYMNRRMLKALQEVAPIRQIKNVSGVPIELTPREKEVLQLVCRQYSNLEIARKLYISPRTVEGHRNNLLLKSGCRNTAGLVLFAIRAQLFHVIN